MSNTIFYKIGSSAPEKNIPPDPCTNLQAIAKGINIELTWSDPSKITESEDGIVAVWSYSVLVRKDNGYPTTPEDGVEVCRSSVLNQYQNEPYLDPITVRDKTYYYSVFAVSSAGKSSSSTSVIIDVPLYRIMTVKINEADSNPATCCSYSDDAVYMSSGKDVTEWSDFFGYKPCLFKDGHVVGYLNPNDYTKFENEAPADITSGDSGDVMVEFPRRGVRISKSGDVVTVSMTDNPDDPEFTYYAHTRGKERRDKMYIGAYLAYIVSWTPRSISGKAVSSLTTGNGLTSYRDHVHTNLGEGYEILTFYQWVYLQVMYLLQFKNLDSQSSVGGIGLTSNSAQYNTGSLDKNGMIFGDTTNRNKPVKLFGLENLWGQHAQILDGCMTKYDGKFYTATDNFNSKANNYNYVHTFESSLRSGLKKVAGTSEAGFMPSETGGSMSTYYCDFASCYNNDYYAPTVGGNGLYSPVSASLYAGMFFFSMDDPDPTPGIGILYNLRISYY